MAGVKRRSGYRKNVTSGVLDELPEPEDSQRIGRILGNRGGNILEIETEDGATGLCLLPTKFRKLVWVKRGDHIIVSGSEDDVETSGGGKAKVTFLIEHILYKDQVKHLQSIGRWPECFPPPSTKHPAPGVAATADAPAAPAPSAAAGTGGVRESKAGDSDGDEGGDDAEGGGDDSDDMGDVFQNNNRRRYGGVASDTESDSDSDEPY